MEPLLIKGQLKFPRFNFNPQTGVLKIVGRSIPENPVKLYEPIINWINDYIASKPENLALNIYLDYLNTHSNECILILIKMIADYARISNANVKVMWYFDEYDEDMETLGREFSKMVDFPFEYQEQTED